MKEEFERFLQLFDQIVLFSEGWLDRMRPEQLDWAQQLLQCGVRAYFCSGDAKAGYTALDDAWWTIGAYLRIWGPDLYCAYLRPEEEFCLAQMVAEANLAQSNAEAEKEARKLERSLQSRAKKK